MIRVDHVGEWAEWLVRGSKQFPIFGARFGCEEISGRDGRLTRILLQFDEKFSFLRDFADLDVVREIFISSYCDLEIDFRGRQFWRTVFSFDQA